jgi:cyclin-dependent kinase 12/13
MFLQPPYILFFMPHFYSTVKTGMYTIYQVEQLHKIFKLCGSPSEEYWKKSKLPHATIFKPQQPYKRCIKETFKDFPTSALPLVETLLAIDPAERQTATAALHSDVCSYPFSSS